MSEVFKIKKFDIENIKQNKNILIIGPQYSGKSHLLKNILYFLESPFAVLVNPGEFATNFFGKILPEQCKVDEVNNELLEKLVYRQRELVRAKKRGYRGDDFDTGCTLIMDNCVPDLFEMKWEKNKFFKFMFQCGKDVGLSTIFTSPYPLKIPEYYLTSIDYVFLLKDTNNKNKRKLFDQFGGMFGDFAKFKEVMDTCTDKFACLVIDRTKPATNPGEMFHWYRAPTNLAENYLGSKNLWKLCYKSRVKLDDMLGKPTVLFK